LGCDTQASPHSIVITTSAACTLSSVSGLGELAGDRRPPGHGLIVAVLPVLELLADEA
jgi:hypothetical protein